MKIDNKLFRRVAKGIVGRIAIGTVVGAVAGATTGFALGAAFMGLPHGALVAGAIYGIAGAVSGAISAINIRRPMHFAYLEGMAGGAVADLMAIHSGIVSAPIIATALVPATAASFASRVALNALLAPKGPA